jgi:hypothetical protein
MKHEERMINAILSADKLFKMQTRSGNLFQMYGSLRIPSASIFRGFYASFVTGSVHSSNTSVDAFMLFPDMTEFWDEQFEMNLEFH